MESFVYHSFSRRIGKNAFMNRSKMSDSIAIVSGGLDSTVLVYDMLEHGYTPHMLSFNYGQRHNKELRFAEYTAKKLGLRHDIIDLTGLTHLISNSALTSQNKTSHPAVPRIPPIRDFAVPLNELTLGGLDLFLRQDRAIEVPEGHYAEDSMKATVVPNRNMIMLSIAGGIAVNNKYKFIATGVHGGDHFIYPDCRPTFIYHAARTIWAGNEGFHNFEVGQSLDVFPGKAICAPYTHKTKADIAYRGIELGVPFEETWSCYKGGDKHCGRCGTCVERLEAIHEAELKWFDGKELQFTHDVTQYADRDFWKTVVKNA